MMTRHNKNGFTIVELLIALMVSSIVLSAVATLAHAAGSADAATDQAGRDQGQLRQLSMRLGDMIRQSNQVVMNYDWGCVLWQDRNADGDYSQGELIVIYQYQFYDTETMLDTQAVAVRYLADNETVCANASGWNVGFSILADIDGNFSYETTQFAYNVWSPDSSDAATAVYTRCQSPEFCYFDAAGNACGTGYGIHPRAVMVRFTIRDNGQTSRRTVSARLRISDDY